MMLSTPETANDEVRYSSTRKTFSSIGISKVELKFQIQLGYKSAVEASLFRDV